MRRLLAAALSLALAGCAADSYTSYDHGADGWYDGYGDSYTVYRRAPYPYMAYDDYPYAWYHRPHSRFYDFAGRPLLLRERSETVIIDKTVNSAPAVEKPKRDRQSAAREARRSPPKAHGPSRRDEKLDAAPRHERSRDARRHVRTAPDATAERKRRPTAERPAAERREAVTRPDFGETRRRGVRRDDGRLKRPRATSRVSRATRSSEAAPATAPARPFVARQKKSRDEPRYAERDRRR